MALKEITEKVLTFDKKAVAELIKAEIERGTAISEILNEGLIAAMDEVGKRFSQGDIFVPEMLLSAQTMKVGLEVLRPNLTKGEVAPKGTIVVGTVKGDLHDIGKNLVCMMLEGAGFNIVDLGVDVESSLFLEETRNKRADIVALSALLTTTLSAMEETVKLVKKNEPACKIMVGGAPVTSAFAAKIGADGFGENAAGAVEVARGLVNAR